jgi:two-component system, NtrC family, response regulator AtoC
MPHEPPAVLIATADEDAARQLGGLMFEQGFQGVRVSRGSELRARLDERAFDLIFADQELPGLPATELLSLLAERELSTPVVAIVGDDGAAVGVSAVRAGAHDFLCKPIDRDEVLYVLGKVQKSAALGADEPPRSVLFASTTKLVGDSTPMRQLNETLRLAANAMATVLIRGESGTGKELVARLVHDWSPRRAGPFVKVHCAALPDQLLESELFGYERGAFTGATARKPGRVELSQGGTLFLDEIGDISPQTQVKLLRVLQDRQYERLGGTQTLRADVRFVTATHRDLETMVRQGTFREDLFYRLNVVSLFVPPLRARPDDIEPLALHFCETIAKENGRRPVLFEADALTMLSQQSWPGNVRELQNFIERVVVLATRPRISIEDVKRELVRGSGALALAASENLGPPMDMNKSAMELAIVLKKAEKRALERALAASEGNKNRAARLLGISRRSLYYKLEEHGLVTGDGSSVAPSR